MRSIFFISFISLLLATANNSFADLKSEEDMEAQVTEELGTERAQCVSGCDFINPPKLKAINPEIKNEKGIIAPKMLAPDEEVIEAGKKPPLTKPSIIPKLKTD